MRTGASRATLAGPRVVLNALPSPAHFWIMTLSTMCSICAPRSVVRTGGHHHLVGCSWYPHPLKTAARFINRWASLKAYTRQLLIKVGSMERNMSLVFGASDCTHLSQRVIIRQ